MLHLVPVLAAVAVELLSLRIQTHHSSLLAVAAVAAEVQAQHMLDEQGPTLQMRQQLLQVEMVEQLPLQALDRPLNSAVAVADQPPQESMEEIKQAAAAVWELQVAQGSAEMAVLGRTTR